MCTASSCAGQGIGGDHESGRVPVECVPWGYVNGLTTLSILHANLEPTHNSESELVLGFVPCVIHFDIQVVLCKQLTS